MWCVRSRKREWKRTSPRMNPYTQRFTSMRVGMWSPIRTDPKRTRPITRSSSLTPSPLMTNQESTSKRPATSSWNLMRICSSNSLWCQAILNMSISLSNLIKNKLKLNFITLSPRSMKESKLLQKKMIKSCWLAQNWAISHWRLQVFRRA